MHGDGIIDRLIQDVTSHHVARLSAAAGSARGTALALLRADLPGEIWSVPESRPRWRVLPPSVLAATGYPGDTADQDTTAWLLSRAGSYLRSQGEYAEALPLDQRALRIRETVLGPDHPSTRQSRKYVEGE